MTIPYVADHEVLTDNVSSKDWLAVSGPTLISPPAILVASSGTEVEGSRGRDLGWSDIKSLLNRHLEDHEEVFRRLT